ncbi:hypothetical protein C8R46DRAFT_277269 [Mycena filopes]|nr:hypothetical protein C8R46DRAFT_277269 [Mycena filopes]
MQPGTKDYEDCAGPALTIWDKWQPACDACGRLESSLEKQQLLSCAGCLLAKYCSKECQKQDWRSHKHRCHLFEADRKLSTVFAKSLGPGTINDPTLSLADKVIQWNFLNVHSHSMIAAAALKNNEELALLTNVGIFLKLVGERTGSKYDNRTFIVERVALFPRETSDEDAAQTVWKYGNADIPEDERRDQKFQHSKMLVGYCMLPNGKMADTQLWILPIYRLRSLTLPPNYDLHQYITHVNRGVTHFHAAFLNLPRDMSDAALEDAEPSDKYCDYAFDHLLAVSGLKGQGVIGIQEADGTRTPLFKRGQNGHLRKCAPGETDSDGPAAYKKVVTDPSRMVRKIAKHLEYLYELQDRALGMTEKKYPMEMLEANLLKYGAKLD